ncbi:hypothetical protein PWT90_03528 [Aphanocladium album]|nr:hypothetical protein PWT90_03528 [Aphanocladium album]
MTRFLVLAALAIVPSALAWECEPDNCARAVTGTRRGDAFVTGAKSDCSKFMDKTVTAPAVTVTATVQPPWYATACPGTHYSSACSCWGIHGETSTITPTSTVTVTIDAVPTK